MSGLQVFGSSIYRRNAQPVEKLHAAYKKFIARSMTRPKATDEDLTENQSARSFGRVLAKGETRTQTTASSDIARKKLKQDRVHGAPLSIYKDTTTDISLGHQSELPKTDQRSWHILGARAERNKENSAVPTKWTSNKIPQKPGYSVRGATAATASPCIEVFVDEECAELERVGGDGGKSSSLQIRHGDGRDLKKETELLRENPLRNFPLNCLPR